VAGRIDPALKCPSAQPGMSDVAVLGIVSREGDTPQLAYIDEPIPATPEILALAAPAATAEVFRLSARCEEKKCTHFDGARCQLAVRIKHLMPEVTATLPPCNIRRECRWFRQEGRAACLRCPQIVTGNPDADERLRDVAGMPDASTSKLAPSALAADEQTTG